MQDIIKEYGPAVISVVAIVALVGLVTSLIGSDDTSVVGQAFANLLDDFFARAGGVME